MKCSDYASFEPNLQAPGSAQNGPSNKEKKREMKFQAKMMQASIMVSCNEPCSDFASTTEDEETEEDGTGNTGKPWRPRCWHTECHHTSESDEHAQEGQSFSSDAYLTAAHQMETLF